MSSLQPFVDINCHLVTNIDDGANSWSESREMADMAAADGISTIVVTPHQLGNYGHNTGSLIRERTRELQDHLHEHQIPLTVLPGADVRIEDGMIEKLSRGEVLSLGDHRKHVLLELPHELYFPIQGVLGDLRRHGMEGILSHPERNQGLLKEPRHVEGLVEEGCLMQVTAGSLMGTFGPHCQSMAEWMIEQRLTHFVSTDAHGPRSRRPLLRRAFERVVKMTDRKYAIDICCNNPAAVATGCDVKPIERIVRRCGISSWFSRRKAG